MFSTRIDNMRILEAQCEGGKTEMARKLGYGQPSYISQMCGPNPSRPISEHTARKIEHAFGLAPGWMDEPHDALGNPLDSATIDDLWAQCLRLVLQVLHEKRRPTDPDKVATLVSLLYEHARAHGGVPDRAHLEKLISLT